ncbi:hypothetical protein [Nonomuraea sp. JJY05]|uniref:hypothetical protein n=1 Tax=Nonomuraea sp. JJY05 TaxID=3350255 RepID=UPI00373F6133
MSCAVAGPFLPEVAGQVDPGRAAACSIHHQEDSRPADFPDVHELRADDTVGGRGARSDGEPGTAV